MYEGVGGCEGCVRGCVGSVRECEGGVGGGVGSVRECEGGVRWVVSMCRVVVLPVFSGHAMGGRIPGVPGGQ